MLCHRRKDTRHRLSGTLVSSTPSVATNTHPTSPPLLLQPTMRLSSTLLLLLGTANTAPTTPCLAFSVQSFQKLLPYYHRTSNKNLVARRRYLHRSVRYQHVATTAGGDVFRLSVSAASTDVGAPGTADLPWSELGFEYRPTKSHLRMVYKDGKWGEAELIEVRRKMPVFPSLSILYVLIKSWLL